MLQRTPLPTATDAHTQRRGAVDGRFAARMARASVVLALVGVGFLVALAFAFASPAGASYETIFPFLIGFGAKGIMALAAAGLCWRLSRAGALHGLSKTAKSTHRRAAAGARRRIARDARR